MPRPRLTRTTYRTNYRRGRWWVDYTDPATGTTRPVSTGITDPGAKEAAEIWRDQFVAGREQTAPPPVPLIRDILEGYKASRIESLQAPETLEYSIEALNRHIGNLKPDMLGARTYIQKRKTDRVPNGQRVRIGKRVSNGTIQRDVGVLRAALRWAVKEKWIATAPIIDAPPGSPPRDRWLSHDEVDRLLAAAYLFHLKLFIVLAYHTAARRGAILDLTWDRVDFDQQLITYDLPGRDPSNKKRATVPINSVALTMLQSAYQLRTGDYVVEWRGKPVSDIKHAFRDACARAEIADCTPHILRHTAATHMTMAGVPLREIARYLGDSEAMVEKVYGKHAPDYLRRASDSLVNPTRLRKIENVAETVVEATETRILVSKKPQKTSPLRLVAGKITH